MCAAAFQKGHVSIAAMRFFTVYGPFGRPDMAPAKFMDIIHRGQRVPVYGDGSAIRDFTFIDDIVQGISLILSHPSYDQFEIYNLGKGTETPNSVLDLIKSIEGNLGKKADINFTHPMAGDVPATQADITKAQKAFGYSPQYDLEEGIRKTVEVYLRSIPKYVVALVPSAGDLSALKQRVQELTSQQEAPESILVLDQAADADEQRQYVAGISTAESLRVDLSTPIYAGVPSYFDGKLKLKAEEAFEEASNIFVLVSDPLLPIPDDLISKLKQKISSVGCEVVGSSSAYLVRLDAFLAANQALDTDSRQLVAFPSALLELLRKTDNLRLQIE